MLKIYKYNDKLNMPVIKDVEAEFFITAPIFQLVELEEYDIELIKMIDGLVGQPTGNIITTNIGICSIADLSSGFKGAYLALHYPDRIVSNLEMGNNAIAALAYISEKYDLEAYIVAYRTIDVISDSSVIVNDQIVTLGDIKIKGEEDKHRYVVKIR